MSRRGDDLLDLFARLGRFIGREFVSIFLTPPKKESGELAARPVPTEPLMPVDGVGASEVALAPLSEAPQSPPLAVKPPVPAPAPKRRSLPKACIGLDFGTAYTKVVVRDLGSGRIYPVPFDEYAPKSNRYTLPSDVKLHDGRYELVGAEGYRLSAARNLKLDFSAGRGKSRGAWRLDI
jgi:hypothetical protein